MAVILRCAVDDLLPQAKGAGGLLGKAGRLAEGAGGVLGPIGVGLDVISGGMGIANAHEGFSKGGDAAGWNGVGQAANGAIGATIGSVSMAYPPAAVVGAAWAGYSIGADVLGGLSGMVAEDTAFSADSVTGGYIRGMFGDESIGGGVADALGGGVLGWTAGTATNLAAAPLNAIDTAGGGVVNWARNMLDGVLGFRTEGRDDYWGMAKGAVGDGISAAGSGISSVASSVLSW